MPTVVSQGTLKDATFWGSWERQGGWRVSSERWMDYAAIYSSQVHVRTYVDFIARNIAQLGLHVFRRVGENDRVRLRDHPLPQLIEKPNAWTTRHRLIYSTVVDRIVYGNAYWLKVKAEDRMALLRIPPQIVGITGGLVPTEYEIRLGTPKPLKVQPDGIVHFRSHNPADPIRGLSLLESLRTILDEDLAAVENRRDVWKHSGRQPVIIKRPKSAPPWDADVERRFNAEFTQAFRSPNSADTPMLADDMDIITLSFNAEQNQYAEGRQLTRSEVATALHIPLSMAGVAGASATFASVREYRKVLYVDCLGPSIDELESDVQLQLVPEFNDIDGVYVEANIAEKLQGDFSEQADMLGKAIGRPWMTADEGRARLNLPSLGGDADKLAVPLNIDPSGEGVTTAQAVTATAQRTFARQRSVIEKRLSAGYGSVADAWDTGRWNHELAADLRDSGVSDPDARAAAINAEHQARLAVELERKNGHAQGMAGVVEDGVAHTVEPPHKTVKTVQRDREGRVVRITEEQVPVVIDDGAEISA